jgi:multiple sugar transport system ATP-binding protein
MTDMQMPAQDARLGQIAAGQHSKSVSLRNVGKTFGDTRVLRDLTLDVHAGEFLVLLGESGCGKTTALRIIAGLESATEGTVHVGDKDVTRQLPRDRDVAMVFQSYALYPHKTVYENIAYPLVVRKRPKAEIDAAVREVAASVQLEPLLERYPRQLSGGQRQRVALARAIIRRPAAFLMDEPLSNLDAKLRGHMRAELKHMQHELDITTIYVTHDQIEAMTLAHRVALIDKGELQQLDTPARIYSDPANLFVAGFIGSPPMNFLRGTLANGRFDAPGGDARRASRGMRARRGGRGAGEGQDLLGRADRRPLARHDQHGGAAGGGEGLEHVRGRDRARSRRAGEPRARVFLRPPVGPAHPAGLRRRAAPRGRHAGASGVSASSSESATPRCGCMTDGLSVRNPANPARID